MRERTDTMEHAVAIIGMATHVPGARSVTRFWENLRAGVESISRFSPEELRAAGVPEEAIADPAYVPAAGTVDGMEWFDAGFFGISPRDATIMDPQMRHFLECAWHALEHSGHVPDSFEGDIGVFAGAGAATYFWRNVAQSAELMGSVGYFALRHTGNDKDFLTSRTAYELDLTGPAVSIQTACSTSLVAVHYACQSLLGLECDIALAGGVTIPQPHGVGYFHLAGEVLSPDGHCRPFDASGGGSVFGAGAGVVVLRRLADAIEDGDTIHAVILGSAVNNDGRRKVSYFAPSVDGQSKAVAQALSLAGVSAESIGLVEAHGTGTQLGDPIEVSSLTRVFRADTDARGFCALGSVKSNLGHLDTAAGVTSLIKATLAVRHGEIPATVHFERANPRLHLDQTPFYVNGTTIPWPDTAHPRRACVNSLGVGGTNAHVVLQEPPTRVPSDDTRPWQLLPLSARSDSVLQDAASDLSEHLESFPQVPLADVSFTLRRGRRRFHHRTAVVCDSHEDARALLGEKGSERVVSGVSAWEGRPVAFLFAGGGPQHPGMARSLYEREPVFRDAFDACVDAISDELPGLRDDVFPTPDRHGAASAALRRPSRGLPALFAVQYAQARLWASWGVTPSVMIGHSMGEYTAACLAGVFSPAACMGVVALRGRLFERLEAGGMLSVNLAGPALAERLGPDLDLASVNAPDISVASGPVAEIERLAARLDAEGIQSRRVHIDVAAHSRMLESILPDFRAFLDTLSLSPPTLPVISNLTGEEAGPEMADPGYWVRHLRETVQFSRGVQQLLAPDGPILVEVGPGHGLTSAARAHPTWTTEQPTVWSLPHPTDAHRDAQAVQLTALAGLWVGGADIDWRAFDGSERRHRVPLPGYPFDRAPYFVAPPARSAHDRPRTTAGSETAEPSPTSGTGAVIESVTEALITHDAVLDAAAIRSGGQDSRRIAAFVVYAPGRSATVSELRRHVRAHARPDLVPQVFSEVAAIPRASDGSVMVSDLVDPFAVEDDFVPPRSETELVVAGIWRELLGLERVSALDSFLDVGGHSLVGVRVLARIEEATGVRVEANDLTLQTLGQLAAGIDRSRDGLMDGTPSETDDAHTPRSRRTGLFSRLKRANDPSA